jgi:Uma2 family endonuclease
MASVNFEDRVSIPLGLSNLDDFRRWCHSRGFPQRGRIDYVSGNIEVDMSPEDLFSHGTLKGKLYATLLSIVEREELGHVFTDATRVTHKTIGLSVEPDILFLSYASIDNGRAILVPKSSGEADRFIEIEGSVDLIVEIVSDSSVRKDTETLLTAYFAAGVTEYWIADARHEQLRFRILAREGDGYRAAVLDADRFQRSDLLQKSFRLDRTRSPRGYWQYDLKFRPLSEQI